MRGSGHGRGQYRFRLGLRSDYASNFVNLLTSSYLVHPLTRLITSGVFVAILFVHAIICSLATKVLARLQNIYIVLNVLYVAKIEDPRRHEVDVSWQALLGSHHRGSCRNSQGLQEYCELCSWRFPELFVFLGSWISCKRFIPRRL